MSEVKVLPHAPRPQSCTGGIGVEGWLQQLERAQGLSPAQLSMPPLSDRTVSMPALPGEPPARHCPGQASPQGRGRTPHTPAGRYGTPSGSEEDLSAPPGQWERAHLRSSPRPEPVRIAALASVRNGWLPVQKRAMVCDITSHAQPLRDSTCQDEFNSSITTSISKCCIKKNGFEYAEGKGDKSSTQENYVDPKTRRLSGQTSPYIKQASNLASPEGDLPFGRDRWKKGWEVKRAAFFSDGIHSGDHSAAPRKHSPLHGTASAPVPARATAPPVGMVILPTKPGFSSITAAAQRVPRAHASPSSSGAAAKSDEARSSAPPHLAAVRRRQVSVIKVADTGARPLEFRHSYTEGEGKENAVSRFLQRGGMAPALPSARTEGPTGCASCRPRSCSLADAEGSGEKVYRSTLSLYLCRPSSSGGPAEGDSRRTPPPLSFAGAFRHSDPSLGGPPAPAAKQPGHAAPKKANMGSGRDAACGLNTRPSLASQPGTGTNAESSQQGVGTRPGFGLRPGQSWSLPSVAAKPPENGTQSAEAILALNAASIIASIKLQTRINKMASLLSQQESKKLPEPGNEKVEDSGSHAIGPPDVGVVRRDQGNAGRKARPQPIHWQEPLSHQQEDNAAPLTLKEALQLLRPGFIRRSQRRVREVEQRAQKRRAQQRGSLGPETTQGSRRTCRSEPNPLSGNHSKLADRAIVGKEMLLRSKRTNSSAPDMKRNRQQEKKKVVSQANRLRAAAFKKKLLDQILRRNLD